MLSALAKSSKPTETYLSNNMQCLARSLALVLVPCCAAWSSGAPYRTPFARTAHLSPVRTASIMMARWTPADMKSKSLPLPSEVEELLSDDTSRKEVSPRPCPGLYISSAAVSVCPASR